MLLIGGVSSTHGGEDKPADLEHDEHITESLATEAYEKYKAEFNEVNTQPLKSASSEEDEVQITDIHESSKYHEHTDTILNTRTDNNIEDSKPVEKSDNVQNKEPVNNENHQEKEDPDVSSATKSNENEAKGVSTSELESSENIVKVDNDTQDSNLTFFHWLKFLIDPIIEEFKDGIYVNTTETNNVTDISKANVTLNETTIPETVNATAVEILNTTAIDTANVTDSSGKKTKFQCVGRNFTDNSNATVKLITTARLLQMLNFEKNETENVTDCVLVMFYAPWCHFCAKTAPHYNALARAFPQLDFVAVDTAQFSK